MLKQRLLTAFVMGGLLLICIFLAPPALFAALVGAVVVAAGWEWARLAGITMPNARAAYAAGLAVLCGAFLYIAPQLVRPLLWINLLFWPVALVWVRRYPLPGVWRHRLLALAIGALILIPAGLGLITLQAGSGGRELCAMVVALVAAADTGAYFAGRRWGRRKLAPRVSPGKTLEGLLGGVAAALLLGLIWQWASLGQPGLGVLPVAALVAALAVLGDLFESLLKRHRGVKDSGRILPGHGGMLDRIDGLMAAIPAFILASPLLGLRLI